MDSFEAAAAFGACVGRTVRARMGRVFLARGSWGACLLGLRRPAAMTPDLLLLICCAYGPERRRVASEFPIHGWARVCGE